MTESGTNLNGFHPAQHDPLKCEMKSTEFNGYKSFTRDYFETYFNYSYSYPILAKTLKLTEILLVQLVMKHLE